MNYVAFKKVGRKVKNILRRQHVSTVPNGLGKDLRQIAKISTHSKKNCRRNVCEGVYGLLSTSFKTQFVKRIFSFMNVSIGLLREEVFVSCAVVEVFSRENSETSHKSSEENFLRTEHWINIRYDSTLIGCCTLFPKNAINGPFMTLDTFPHPRQKNLKKNSRLKCSQEPFLDCLRSLPIRFAKRRKRKTIHGAPEIEHKERITRRRLAVVSIWET